MNAHPPMRILIVEDDPLLRASLDEILEPYGQRVLAADGMEAIRIYRAAVETGAPFDLLLLDLMMPGKNGHQVLEEIRLLESQQGVAPDKALKAIVTSGLDDPRQVARAFFQGRAVAYLTKPVSAETLRAELAKFGWH